MKNIIFPALFLAMSLSLAMAQAPDDFSNLVPAATAEDGNDPCRYLAPKDAEAIVGEPLLTAAFRAVGSRADENGGQCRYVFSGFRTVTVDVMKTGGDKVFQTLTGVKYLLDQKMETPGNLSKTLPLEGEWDEVREGPSGSLTSIQSDMLISVGLEGVQLPQEKVVALVNATYKNLDKPLPDNQRDAITAAQALEKTRPEPRDACSLITVQEAESVLGTLRGQPKSDHGACSIPYMGATGHESVDFKVTWRDSYRDYVSLRGSLLGALAQSGLMPKDGSAKSGDFAAVKGGTTGPWEAAFVGSILFYAVRHDTLLELSAPALPNESIAKLATIITRKF